MAQSTTQAAERVTIEDPFRSLGAFGGDAEINQAVATIPMQATSGSALDRAQTGFVTAQRVAVKRNMAAIVREARTVAESLGDRCFYHWEVNNRKTGGKEIVEGPTIVAAMAAVNVYGNVVVRAIPAIETPTHWVFAAEFVDLEKGVTVVRTFQQRRRQDTGMRDAERQQDIVYQIGQSKAIRNAVNAALGWLLDDMVDAAKKGLLQRIAKNPEAARSYIAQQVAALDVPMRNVEFVVGRRMAAWTVPDMARLFANVQTIKDGFANADDLFPAPEATADAPEDVPPAPKPQVDAGRPAASPSAGAPHKARAEAKPTRAEVAPQVDAAPQDSDEEDAEPRIADEADHDASGQLRFD